MIKKFTDYREVEEFINSYDHQGIYSDCLCKTVSKSQKRILKALKDKTNNNIMVTEGSDITGVFSFLVIEDEGYVEMLIGICHNKGAYEEVFEYLVHKYEGYKIYFIVNPQNNLLMNKLTEVHGEFFTEQQIMQLKNIGNHNFNIDVIPYDVRYFEEYAAMHLTDLYWTADKVVAAPEKFHVFLAMKNHHVAGYIDMTCSGEVNEPQDLFVKEEYRNNGYGKALLDAAIKSNYPKKMILHVDVTNKPAIHVYEEMGFTKVDNGNSITVCWNINKEEK